jgi:hypothetical protein
MRRKLVALAALVAGAATGFQLFKRLGSDRRRARVDLYYEDGSLVSLSDAEAAPLLARAREALRATHAA